MSSSTPPPHPNDAAMNPHSFMTDAETANLPHLSEADIAALDAFTQNGYEPANNEPRTSRVASLLSMLAMPVEPSHDQRELLIDVTMARVNQAARRGLTHGIDGTSLSIDDQHAVDAYVSRGYELAADAGDREHRIDRLMSLVGSSTDDPRAHEGELVERTLAAIQHEIHAEEDRLKFEPSENREHGRGRRGWQFADAIAAAAVLLIGGAVLTPVMSMLRDYGSRTACMNNMQAAGMGLASYASDYRDAFPLASASTPGTTWWNVGRPEQSNSANLYTVARTGYVKPAELDCGGNPNHKTPAADSQDWQHFEDVSYSFQNLFTAQRPTWTSSGNGIRVIVIADRSPVTIRARRGEVIYPYANSPNHGERGQNLLANDGSAQWTTSPVLKDGGLGGDNVWLPRSIETLLQNRGRPTKAEPIKGIESPTSKDDVFVGP